jgi:hypothetical protein
MTVESDIINNFKHNKIYKKYEHILEDLEDYDYTKDWVNAPAAFGDTHKHTAVYTIGDFKFKYYHVLASEINSAEFSIKFLGDEKPEIQEELKKSETEKTEKHEKPEKPQKKDEKPEPQEEQEKQKKSNKELIYRYSMMMAMMARFRKKILPDFPMNTKYLNKFKSQYKLQTDDDYYLLFTILNSFTFGHCISIRVIDKKVELVYQHLDELIEIVDPE